MVLLLVGCEPPLHIDPPERCALEAEILADRDHGIAPLSIELAAQSSCEEEFSALWLFEDGSSQEGAEISATFLSAGSHAVELVLSDERGRSGSAILEIEVGPLECPVEQPLTELGLVEDAEVVEPSGLALAEGLLWTHNDSDASGTLFAMDPTGAAVATHALEGEWTDWEDLAAGDGMLLVADIGDNEAVREGVGVRVVSASDPSEGFTLDLTYPSEQGARDANVLLFDPVTGDILIIDAEGLLWRKAAPHTDEGAELELVAELGLSNATGGDISPDGIYLALTSADETLLWLRDPAEPLEVAVQRSPCALELPTEVAAVAFDEDGRGLFGLVEEAASPVWFLGFEDQEQPCTGAGPEIWANPASGTVPLSVAFEIDCVDVDGVTWELEGLSFESPTAEALYLSSGDHLVTALVEHDGGATEVSTTVVVEPATCPVVGARQELGTLASEDILEASGLVESERNPGVFWTHNDAGNAALLFAFDDSGVELGRFELEASRDWEDLALHDGVLYVGDVGDNAKKRDHVLIYLVEEPEVTPAPQDEELDAGVMTLTYPDGVAYDCEAIAVDPVTGDLWLVTKDYDGHSKVFRKAAPHLDGDEEELEWVTDLELGEDSLYEGSGAVTAMDVSPLGDLIGLRTYSDLWLLRRDQADDLATTFAGDPCDGKAPSERQGEAMAFSVDGGGYYTLSEGEAQPLLFKPLD